jgi:hypothetical protein
VTLTFDYKLLEYIVQSWEIQLVGQKPVRVYKVYRVGVSVWNRHLHSWLNVDTEILHAPQWLNMDTTPHATYATTAHIPNVHKHFTSVVTHTCYFSTRRNTTDSVFNIAEGAWD